MRASRRRAHPLACRARRRGSGPAARSPRAPAPPGRRDLIGGQRRSTAASSSTVVMPAQLEVTAQHRDDRGVLARQRCAGASAQRFGRRTTARAPWLIEHLTATRGRPAPPQRAPLGARAEQHASSDSRSWRSSAVSGSGVISACTRSMRLGLERADRREVDAGRPRRSVHRVGAPVLQLLVVEERVRPGGEDLVREHRRLGGVAAVDARPRRTRCARAARGRRRRRAPRAACRRSSGARAGGRGSRSARRCSPGTPRPAGTPRP